MNFFYLYLKIQGANIRSRMMYPFNFFLGIFCVMCFGIFSTLFIYVITESFPIIVGWNFYEILFNVAFNMFCYSMSLLFFIQVYDMDNLVRNAEFDRILVRPINPLLQFACKNFNVNSLGTVGYSLAMLIYSGSHVRDWDIVSLLIAGGLLICGFIVATAIHLIIAATAFITLQSGGLLRLNEVMYDNVADFPLTIFSQKIQLFFTFILPIGFIGYYPSVYLIENKESMFSNYLIYCCVLASILLGLLSVWVWNKSLKHYSSAGS